jgi:hypothetical protein
MKTKFTPQFVLEMLQEIKLLSDQDSFNFTAFTKKYPSFHPFKKILISKGILSNHRRESKWISIVPNIIMAKEVARLYVENRKQYAEDKFYEKIEKINNKTKFPQNNPKEVSILQQLENVQFFKQRNPTMSLAKEIRKDGERWNDAVSRASKIIKKNKLEEMKLRDLTNQELFPNSYAQDFETLNIKYQQLQDELRKTKDSYDREINTNQEYRKFYHNNMNLPAEFDKLKQSLKNQETANKCFKQRISELENQLVENVEIYKNKVYDFKNKLGEKNDEIKRKDGIIKELQIKIDLLYAEGSYKKEDEIIDIPEPIFPDFNFEEPTFEESSLPEPTFEEKTSTPSSRTYKLFGIPVFSIHNK